MKKTLFIISLLGACLAVWFLMDWKGIPLNSKLFVGSNNSNNANRQLRGWKTHAKLVLSQQELDRKFSLSPIERIKIGREISGLAIALLEQKGEATYVREFAGNRLVLVTPAMELPLSEITRLLEMTLVSSFGPGRTAELLADDEGKATLLHQLGVERLFADAIYLFEKTSEENSPEENGTAGFAQFDVLTSFVLADRVEPGIRQKGFCYVNAYNIELSWNAMGKAPKGYFRSELLAGVSSRPPLVPWVFDDSNSDKVEVRDLRYPGSKDVVQPRDG